MIASKKTFSPSQRWLLGWIPFWVISFLVLRGAFMPPEEIPLLFFKVSDKLIHFMEYVLLFLVSQNAFHRAKASFFHSRTSLKAWIYCFAIGTATEIMQFYVPMRFPEWLDWVMNILGSSFPLMVKKQGFFKKDLPK